MCDPSGFRRSQALWDSIGVASRLHIIIIAVVVNGGPTAVRIRHILNVLLVQVASAHVLIGAAIASLSCRHAVALSPEVHPEAARSDFLSALGWLLAGFNLLARLVEVLCRIVCRAERRAVEVVEHQVHVLSLLVLQVVAYLDVTVHLDLDVGISLPRQGSWLCESTMAHQLVI